MKTIILTRDPPRPEHRTAVIEDLGLNHIRMNNWPALKMYGHTVDIPELTPQLRRNLLATIPGVVGFHPSQIFSIPKPISIKQTNVTLDDCNADMNLPYIFSQNDFLGAPDVTFCSVDTGVDLSHNGEFCFQDGPAQDKSVGTPRCLDHIDYAGGPPYHPHGTWTAEIDLRSERLDGSWRAGCYRAKFVYAQCLNAEGSGTTEQIVDGMNFAVARNADLMGLSLGGPHDDVMTAGIEAAWQMGVLAVCASGNSGVYPPDCDQSIMSPADADHAVAAIAAIIALQDPNGKRQSQTWTDRGHRWNGTIVPYPYTAPGVTLSPGYGDAPNSGTSFARPFGSTVLGALFHYAKAWHPELSKQNLAILVRDTFLGSCFSLGYDTSGNHTKDGAWCDQGFGYVDAKAALIKLSGAQPPIGKKYGPASVTAQYTVIATALGNSKITGLLNTTTPAIGSTLTYTGQLIDSDTLAGLAGLPITFVDVGQSQNGSVTTDAQGNFTVSYTVVQGGNQTLKLDFAGTS